MEEDEDEEENEVFDKVMDPPILRLHRGTAKCDGPPLGGMITTVPR